MIKKEIIIRILQAVDDILLDYIERLEKSENAGLHHGRSVALAVKALLIELKQ